MQFKNDSKRHNFTFNGMALQYRLSVKKTHFWVCDVAANKSIQYISKCSGLLEPYGNWNNFFDMHAGAIIGNME